MTEKRFTVTALSFKEDGRELGRGTLLQEGEAFGPGDGALVMGKLHRKDRLPQKADARLDGEAGYTAVFLGGRFLLGKEEALREKSWWERLMAL